MPPSPWLSARMMNVRYFTVTTIVSDQKMSERTPRTSAGDGGAAPPVAAQALVQRVERARPDVAEDDAERAERETPRPAAMGGARGVALGVLLRGVHLSVIPS